MLPLLQLENVTRRFPGVLALDRVDLDLRPGEIHALLGEDGAGKSTLVQVVARMLAPDGGRLLLEGRPSGRAGPASPRSRGVVVVYQEAELFPALTVAENLALARGLPPRPFHPVRRRRLRAEARSLVAELGEPIDLRWPASRLSPSQRQRLLLASAVASRPRVLILDEPTAALTAVESAWLLARLERLRDDGVGVLYASRRHDEVSRIADRISVLRDGRLVWTADASAVDRRGLVRAMVGRDDARPRSARPVGPAPARSKTPRLRVRNMTDARGRFEAVDLDVHAGEVLGLYGLEGDGRVEWARALFGLRRLSRGRIEIDAYPQSFRKPADAVDAGVAYLPGDRLRRGICPGLSVRANMVLTDRAGTGFGPVAVTSFESRVARAQAASLDLRPVDITRPVETLEGGDQQKVVLGRWLLTEPKVLVLDEPTRGMDVAAKSEIHRLVRQRANRGSAVVLVGSHLPELLANADRVAVFRSGRVAAVFDARTAAPEAVAAAAQPTSTPPSPESPARRGTRRRLRREFRGHAPLLALTILVLSAALSATTRGRFLSVGNLLGIAGDTSILAILAIGAATVLVAGGIDLSAGSLLALAAASGALVMGRIPRPGLAVPAGVFAALATGVAGGLLNASLALLGRLPPIVVTLGTLAVYRALFLGLSVGHAVGPLPGAFRLAATGRVRVLDVPLPGSLLVALATTLVASWLFSRTRSGRELRAFGDNPRAAQRVGIGRRRAWLLAFGVGGLCDALAGFLELARDGSTVSGMGTGDELRAIAAAVLGGTSFAGGRGGVAGVVLAALLLSLLRNALVLWEVPRHHHDLAIGGVLLAVLLADRLLRRSEP